MVLITFHLSPLLLSFWAFFSTLHSFAIKKKEQKQRRRGGEENDSHPFTFSLAEHENALEEMAHEDLSKLPSSFCGGFFCYFPGPSHLANESFSKPCSSPPQAERSLGHHGGWHPLLAGSQAPLESGRAASRAAAPDRLFSSSPTCPRCHRTDGGSWTLWPHPALVLG